MRGCFRALGGLIAVPLLMMARTELAGAQDLNELYVLALSNDPTFQAAGYTLTAAKQIRPEAFSALMPSIVGTGAGSKTYGRTVYTGTPLVDRAFQSDQWSVQLTQPLFRIQNNLAYSEAKSTVEQSVAQYSLAAEDLILRVARAYFDVVVAERHIVTSKAQVASLNEQLAAAQHSYEAGVASITDVDDTRSRAALAEAQLDSAISDLESSRAAMEAIVGTRDLQLSALRETAVLARPEPSEVSSWVERAVSDNSQVKAAQAAVAIADWELKRSQLQRLPSVDLVASYGGSYASGNITDPSNFGSNVKDRQIGVQFSMPIIDGGAIHAHVAESRARRSKAQADLTTAERQAALAARQSFAAVQNGLAQIHALETAVASGRNAVKGNKVGYGLGIRINSDVLNAEQQLYSSIQDLDKARYDALFDGLKLKAATGSLSADDLRAINDLLEPGRLAGVHP